MGLVLMLLAIFVEVNAEVSVPTWLTVVLFIVGAVIHLR